jgi:excisionase family DNA binding protein
METAMRNHNDNSVSGREGLSVDDACHVAGIGKSSMFELIKAGAVPARRFGRRTIILRSDLLAWLSALPRLEPEAA